MYYFPYSIVGHKQPDKNKKKKPRKSFIQSLIGYRLAHNAELDGGDISRLEAIKQRSARIRELIQEYDEFYEKWLEKLAAMTGDEENMGNFEDKAGNGKNISFAMVTYNGNN